MTQSIDWHDLRPLSKEMLERAMDPQVQANLIAVPISQLACDPVDLDDTVRREYVVTLHNRCDLENFYDEMEHAGSRTGCVPARCVDVAQRRPISRNTHYYLTDAEAEALKSDQRVQAVEPHRDITLAPLGWQTWQTGTTWDKSLSNQSNMLDWQPLRSYLGQQIPNWGSASGGGNPQVSGTLKLTGTGANVDVVIVDGLILADHPEYAVNPDGTGGSRVVQFNWLSLNPVVTGAPPGTYNYSAGSDGNKNHGMHVAGIACGNTQGWARDANIYNIGPYGENGLDTSNLMDYIRAWHAAKPINPVTGQKNPTISNHSYGTPLLVDNIEPDKGGVGLTRIDYRGVAYTPAPPATFIDPLAAPTVGVLVLQATINNVLTFVALANERITALEVDYLDAMAEGIICVGASGNSFAIPNDVPGGQDFNNAYYRGPQPVRFQNRGLTPTCAGTIESGFISVNNIGAVLEPTTRGEMKDLTSSCGPRSQINAPGSNIFSASFGNGALDPRNPSYTLAKQTGTSMASPGVCGALACMMEKYPWVSQEDCINYLINYSKNDQLDNVGDPNSVYSLNNLRGTPNRYLFFNQERPDEAAVYPWQKYWFRPQSGVAYPRRPATNSQPKQWGDYLSVQYLVVGGGGGGATGGGGAGGFRADSGYQVLAGLRYSVVVGAGGSGGDPLTPGSSSTFDVISAAGGGRAGGNGPGISASAGGSGGGGAGSGFAGVSSGGAGNVPPVSPSQGNRGGDGLYVSGPYQALGSGGGGGAGGAGQNGTDARGGDGGLAIASDITGTTRYYCGGGGGAANADEGRNFPNGLGGGTAISNQKGGAGDGGRIAGVPGTANTGGGGGGAGVSPVTGASGGSGVVILRYPDTYTITNPGGGLTFTTSTAVPGVKITTFTAGSGIIRWS